MEMVDHLKGALKLKKKPNDKKCDFTIVVGEESIKVHRSKLRKVTDYFDKRYPPSFDDQHNVCTETESSFEALKMCVHFVYKKDVWFALTNVGPLLTLARKWQIQSLVTKCDGYIRGQINPKSCVRVKKLAQEIGDEDIEKVADKYMLVYLGRVAESGEVADLTESEVRWIINDYLGPNDEFGIPKLAEKDQILWKFVTTWVKCREIERAPLFCDILREVPFSFFSFEHIEKEMLQEPLVTNCSECTGYITEHFLDVLEHRIEFAKSTNEFGVEQQFCSAADFFFLQSFARKHDRQSVVAKVGECIKQNLGEIVTLEEFKQLEKDELLSYLIRSDLAPDAASDSWEAVITWVKHEQGRKVHFYELFQQIKLEDLPLDFIQSTVMQEKLVKNSPQCKDIILEAVLKRRMGA